MDNFIVLEGLDGSGKSTQTNLLKKYFEQKNINYKYLHFPQTHTPYFGDLISRFLRGELGKIDDVDPYLVAMLYAGDRKDAAPMIRKWENTGDIVLVDRYVMSNIAFQTAKLCSQDKKEELRQWIFKLEYEHFGIPKPSLSIFLDVPISFVKKNIDNQRYGYDREYLQGKSDIHEEHIEFQEQVRLEYLKTIKMDNNFVRIDCVENGAMKAADKVFSEIIHLLSTKKIIQ